MENIDPSAGHQSVSRNHVVGLLSVSIYLLYATAADIND